MDKTTSSLHNHSVISSNKPVCLKTRQQFNSKITSVEDRNGRNCKQTANSNNSAFLPASQAVSLSFMMTSRIHLPTACIRETFSYVFVTGQLYSHLKCWIASTDLQHPIQTVVRNTNYSTTGRTVQCQYRFVHVLARFSQYKADGRHILSTHTVLVER